MNVQLLIVISEMLPWVFEGIGTEIVSIIASFIVGALSGGIVGYRIGVKIRNKLSQKAGNHASQLQIGSVNIHNEK